MPNLNKVMLMGNLTRDPELRYTPNNTAVANLGMAINRRWFNKQTNENQEETTFVDLEAWGRTAEVSEPVPEEGPAAVRGRPAEAGHLAGQGKRGQPLEAEDCRGDIRVSGLARRR